MGRNKALGKWTARRVLRSTAESNLHYMLSPRSLVTDELQRLCAEARWEYDSYFMAVLFLDWELIKEITK